MSFGGAAISRKVAVSSIKVHAKEYARPKASKPLVTE